ITKFEREFKVCIGTVAYIAADKKFQYAGTSEIVAVLQGIEDQVAEAMKNVLGSRIGAGSSASTSSTGPVVQGAQSTLQEKAVPLKQLLQIETDNLTNDQLRMVIRTIVMGPGKTPKFAWQQPNPAIGPNIFHFVLQTSR
ncbi:uncharacterized protein, partial [Amphiura filiformis]|uniref:uncharacterized protein n=1 Tax=Amphiura filiformis TaxID=82378 RepID=UPI003B21F2B1